MALDNACTPNEYAKHRVPIVRSSDGFKFTPAYDDETANLKWGLDSVDIWVPTSTQEYPLGSKLERGCQTWRYCRAGATGLNISAPVQAATPAHAEQDDDIVVAQAQSIGDTSVYLTSTANLDTSPNDSDNTFAGGFLFVNDAAGQGQCCLIRANAAFSGTEDSEFELVDKLTIALTTSSQVGLIRNPYNQVIVAAAPVTGKLIGVPQMAVTANYYFWCLTQGPGAVVAQDAIQFGTDCYAVAGVTSGKADPAVAITTGVLLGTPLTPGVTDTEQFMCWLQCE